MCATSFEILRFAQNDRFYVCVLRITGLFVKSLVPNIHAFDTACDISVFY